MKLSTVLKEGGEDSPFSARRFIAFILVFDSIFNTLFAMKIGLDDWHLYLNIIGLPLLMATILLFCTTVNDIVDITTSIKGANKNNRYDDGK